jgi:hypothetical protein
MCKNIDLRKSVERPTSALRRPIVERRSTHECHVTCFSVAPSLVNQNALRFHTAWTQSGRNRLSKEVYGFRHALLKGVAHRDRLSPSLGDHELTIVTVSCVSEAAVSF